MIHQSRADHAHPIHHISPVRTITRSPRSNVKTQRIKSQSDTHLGITIDAGRQPAAARGARSAATIHTAPLVVILVGWSRC